MPVRQVLSMEHYSDSEWQIRLRKRAYAYLQWTRNTGGACNTGCCLGTDDPESLGWDVLLEHLEHDGVFELRLLPTDTVAAEKARLGLAGHGVDFQDVFTGSASEILETTDGLDFILPDRLEHVPEEEFVNPDIMHSIQECMVRCGVAPFSGLTLSGRAGPSYLTALRESGGRVVATSFGHLPHNRFSPHHRSAWAGLVSVDESWRGLRLGVLVNALAVRACVEKLDAHSVYELVSETNLASRRMVERCGLSYNAFYKSGLAYKAGVRHSK